MRSKAPIVASICASCVASGMSPYVKNFALLDETSVMSPKKRKDRNIE